MIYLMKNNKSTADLLIMDNLDIFKLMCHHLDNMPKTVTFNVMQKQKPGQNSSIHIHDGYELRMHFSPNGFCLTQIDVICPGSCHVPLNQEESARAHVLEIRENTASFLHGTMLVPQYLSSPYKDSLVQCLNSLVQEPDSAVCKKECLMLLSLFYLRASSAANDKPAERLQIFAHYLETFYYNSSLSIVNMAEQFGISPGYIQTVFKSRYALNPKEYLLKIRMEKAAELLSEQRYYIGEIASLCGFSNARYFAGVFRKYYGCTPTEYARKQPRK